MPNLLERLQKDKRKAKAKGQLKEIADLCNAIGNELQSQGKYEDALEEHEEEAFVNQKLADKIGMAVAYRRIGEVYCEINKWKESLTYQRKYLGLSLEAQNLIEVQRAYATIGRTYFRWVESLPLGAENITSLLKQSEEAYLESLKKCEKIAKKLDEKESSEMLCRIYHNLGLVVELKGDIVKGIQFISQALEMCLEYSLVSDAYRAYAELARLHMKQEKFQLALEESLKSLNMAKKEQNKTFQAEACSLIGQVSMQQGDYPNAKKYYYKAFKLHHPNEQNREEIEKNLKSVAKIMSYMKSVQNDSSTYDEKIHIYEKLGDKCCDLLLFKQAINFYDKVIEIVSQSKNVEKPLGPIYVSIGHSYKDLKDYKMALEFFQKELDICLGGDPKAPVLTLNEMNRIFNIENSGYDERYYNQAFNIAKESNRGDLIFCTIKTHLELDLPQERKEKLKVLLQDICTSFGIDENAQLFSEEDTSTTDEDIDLDDLSFSDSDEEKETLSRHVRISRRTAKLRINEKGETALHVASLKGDLKKVQLLLKQNWPVNARDHCGWTPLHEACNEGNLSVVKVLLDAGASINDRGGNECQGVTPLHDAVNNGHLFVAELLLKRGASPVIKNDKGETALDCLALFNEDHSLSDEERHRLEKFKKSLIEAMEKSGFDTSRGLAKEHLHEKLPVQSIEIDNDIIEVLKNEEPYYAEKTANYYESDVALYKNVMGNLRGRSNDYQDFTSKSKSPKRPVPALISEEENVDNWLIDDLEESSKKRKIDHPSNFSNTEKKRFILGKKKQTKLTSVITSSLPNESQKNVVPNNTSHDRPYINNSVSSHTAQSKLSQNFSATYPPLRLHVTIKNSKLSLNDKLLIPVAYASQNQSIKWLEEEITRRFHQHSKIKAHVALYTIQNELLNRDDSINMVLSEDNNELIASIIDFEVSSMSTQYEGSCKDLNVVCFSNVRRILLSAESTGILDFSKSYLRGNKEWLSVINSLKFQNLNYLNLSYCKVKDGVFLELLKNMESLFALSKLDLVASDLTTDSFYGLSKLCHEMPSTLKNLSELDLSYNNFFKVKISDFKSILSLPSLISFTIKSCQMTMVSDNPRQSAILFNIKNLILDDNKISRCAFEEIVSLSPYIEILSLANSCFEQYSSAKNSLCGALSSLLGRGSDCLLKSLNLSSYKISDDDIKLVVDYFYRCSSLECLDISYNDDLSLDTVIALLKEIALSTNIPLKELHFSGISSLHNEQFVKVFLQTLKVKLGSVYPIIRLSLPYSSELDSALEIWKEFYKDRAIVKKFSSEVVLCVK